MNTTRRHFLIGTGISVAGSSASLLTLSSLAGQLDAASIVALKNFQPHAFVRISSDNTVTVIIGKSEMGQGIYTGMPMILAEELDINPQRLKVEIAGIDPAFNSPFLPMQFTGGSTSTISTYEALRTVGANARYMLISAAATRWQVDATSLSTDNGVVFEILGKRRASYGSLASDAASLPLPKKGVVNLKERKNFKYIGKPQKRLDSLIKVTGKAIFGLDVAQANMLIAVVARAPSFGATVKSFEAGNALAIKGVVEVKQVPSGIAVLAHNTWAALKGREALDIIWAPHPEAQHTSTVQLREQWRALLLKPGNIGKDVGDVTAALNQASKKIDVEYESPYLAHACMEPMNATAYVTEGKCELWVGTQTQTQDAQFVGSALGIPPASVTIHTTFLGGGFGRRASSTSDFSVEAAQVAQGAGCPVKVMWTREDDMRGGYYRPFSISRIRAGIGEDGLPVAYHHVAVGKPVLANTPFGKIIIKKGSVDPSSMEGAANLPYAIPNTRIEIHDTNEIVPNLWWRSVGHSITAFVTNGMIDELAALAGRDPYQYRRSLLKPNSRELAVLDKAASTANWGKPLLAGRHHGISLHESFGSLVAQVAEVSVKGTEVRVHRVTCAVDCGTAVNPDQVIAQMQSAVVYGLSAALTGEITMENGRPVQGNFNDYPVLRNSETPAIDVHILDSGAPMGGVGEPGTPPVAPAVCAAIYAATGQRIRKLPISQSLA